MNKALKALKEANPKLYGQFMELLTEDLGLGIQSSSGSLRCPNCHAQFQVALSQMESGRVSRLRTSRTHGQVRSTRKWKPKPDSLFMLLVKVARIRRTTTGNVSAEFNKATRARIKNLPPKEIRKIKIDWLNEQIAKARSKNRAA